MSGDIAVEILTALPGRVIVAAITALRMNPRVTALTKCDQIGCVIRAAVSKRQPVMDLFGRNVEPTLKAQLTQWVLGDVTVTDALPCASVPALGLRAAVVFFVACVFLFLMLRAVPSVCQVRTAGEGAWPLGFPWHCFTSLSGIRKALQETGSHKASHVLICPS